MGKKKDWAWYGGLSYCCDAPIKEYGEGITVLVCSACDQMCNVKRSEDDYEEFPDEEEDD